MPPKPKEFSAVCLVLDVGLTSHASHFLDHARRCASELIQRRLFGESQDRIGLVLVGDRTTANSLNYDHVRVLEGGFRVADWNMLDFVENHVQGTDIQADWVDGVIVALDLIKTETEDQGQCQEKKIVLLSDLGCPANTESIEAVVLGMKQQKVEFVFFGPTWDEANDEDASSPSAPTNGASNDAGHDSLERPKPQTAEQKANVTLARHLVEETEGITCSVDDALANLMYHERRKKKPFPWKVNMEIGPQLSINTVGYIQTRREPPKSWKKCLAQPPPDGDVDELKADTTFVKNNDAQEVVDGANLIESYKYGTELVTVSEEDKANFSYDGGPKSLMVLGFVPKNDLNRQWLLGDGCMVFQPVEGDEASNAALASLSFAMYDLGVVALVRKVYRAKSTPRMGVLIPEYRPNDDGVDKLVLVFIELPYAEDLRQYEFAPVFNDSIRPSANQLDAMDSYIDHMMLVGDNEDLIKTEDIMNPCHQYLYHCLTHRVTKPGRILPDVATPIKNLMKPPPPLAATIEDYAEKLKALFPCEEVERAKGKVTGEQMFADKRKDEGASTSGAAPTSDDLALAHAGTIIEVGTTTPVEDFHKLVAAGGDWIAVAQQLERIIEKLIQASLFSQLYGKICSCLQAYRAMCLLKDQPRLYNDFLGELKHTVESQRKTDLLGDIRTANLGIIAQDEHAGSNYTAEAGRSFLEAPPAAPTEMEVPAALDDDDEDMLDDL